MEVVPLNIFRLDGKDLPVSFVETIKVTDGVECDVYSFVEDDSKDLGIIRIKPGKRTPLQKVLGGDKTVEGYVSGKGVLRITKPDGHEELHETLESPLSVEVKIGEMMQWEAASDYDLTAYEICWPPYQDGRYENIT